MEKITEKFSAFKPVECRKISNLFIISLEYLVPIEVVERHMPAHREFLDRGYHEGAFIASGRKVPRTGGVILAQSRNKEVLEALISSDPFKIHGLADYSITEFEPTRYNEFIENTIHATSVKRNSN